MRLTKAIGAGVTVFLLHACGGGGSGTASVDSDNSGGQGDLDCSHPAYQTLFQQWAGVATKSEPGTAVDGSAFSITCTWDVVLTLVAAPFNTATGSGCAAGGSIGYTAMTTTPAAVGATAATGDLSSLSCHTVTLQPLTQNVVDALLSLPDTQPAPASADLIIDLQTPLSLPATLYYPTQSSSFEVMRFSDAARTITFASGVLQPVAP
ncbi:MAG: hypothetical protein WBD34_02320 [Burkholderiaceae bacterium]